MANNSYQTEKTVGRYIPNWLSSEVGLTQKTYEIPSSLGTTQDDGTKILKSGSVVTIGGTVVGLLFGPDVDLTKGNRLHSVMIAGRVLENRLPASVTDSKSALTALGIYFDEAPEVTRE